MMKVLCSHQGLPFHNLAYLKSHYLSSLRPRVYCVDPPPPLCLNSSTDYPLATLAFFFFLEYINPISTEISFYWPCLSLHLSMADCFLSIQFSV